MGMAFPRRWDRSTLRLWVFRQLHGEIGHRPSWPRNEIRRPCSSSRKTLSIVPLCRPIKSRLCRRVLPAPVQTREGSRTLDLARSVTKSFGFLRFRSPLVFLDEFTQPSAVSGSLIESAMRRQRSARFNRRLLSSIPANAVIAPRFGAPKISTHCTAQVPSKDCATTINRPRLLASRVERAESD